MLIDEGNHISRMTHAFTPRLDKLMTHSSQLRLRRVLVYTHRWLGIAGCVLFVMWFASGIVMMYVRMPDLSAAERLARMAPLDLSTARVSIVDAADAAGRDVERIRINMLADRPVYRFATRAGSAQHIVYADTGGELELVSQDLALGIARRFAPDHAPTLRYAALLTDPDQWTLGNARRALPLHRIALGDAAGTSIYVSQRTGEVVMKTTARERRWAYAGAIPHWIYFTPLRRHGPIWTQTIIWLSIAGCALCLTGLAWGVWRLSIFSTYRLKHAHSHSPYAGLMRWHHYAGLIFGVATFTWVFSGLLSMDPWDWHPPTSPTRQQREAVSGGPLHLDGVTLDALQEATDVLSRHMTNPAGSRKVDASSLPVRELEIVQFRGERFLMADSGLVSLDAPTRGVVERFGDDVMLESARGAMPGVSVRDAVWLTVYDAYYYDRARALPLPVLRVRYDDPQQTWLYLDAGRGSIVRREERLSRVNRWLYHGLHSLDFPILYNRRPLWDIVVIALSLGGLVVSATTLVPAGTRLRRHWRRLSRLAHPHRLDDRHHRRASSHRPTTLTGP